MSAIDLVLDGVIFDLQRGGGVSRYWFNLVRGLIERADIRSLVVLQDPASANPFARELRARFDARPGLRLQATRANRVTRYLEPALAADLVDGAVFHSSYFRTSSACLASVTTVHDFIFEREIGGLASRVHRWQKARALRRSRQVVCVSDSTRRDLLQFHPDIDPRRVHVVHHGVDDAFGMQGEVVEAARPYALFVGKRVAYKNFDPCVAALSGRPQLDLVVVGPSPDEPERALLNRHLPGRWRHEPEPGDERLAALYRGAFALLYPSRYEGFGLPLLEAMACGCPFVAFARSSIPEIAGDAGLLIDVDSPAAIAGALDRLADPAYREDRRQVGLARVAGFSWGKAVDAHAALYRDALARG